MAERESEGLPIPAPKRRPVPDTGRRFRADEVDVILRRATSHEVHGPLTDTGDATLADLMAAARDVGLDPALVRRAASVRPDPGGGVAAALLGAPDHREVRAWVPAVRLPDAPEELARVAEQLLGARGEIQSTDESRFLWKEDHLWGRTTVSLEAGESGTDLRVAADRAGHYAGLFMGGLAGWALLSSLTPLGGLLAGLGPLGVVGGMIAIPLLLARPFWSRSDRAVRLKLERLAMELARVADEVEGNETPPPALPPSEEDGGP